MTNKKKLEALKAFLTENNVRFIENYQSKFGVTMDLKLPDLMIAVFLSEGKDKDEEIYNTQAGKWKMRFFYKPFFIRDSDAKKFVLEKMQSCIVDRMVAMQKRWEKKSKKRERR